MGVHAADPLSWRNIGLPRWPSTWRRVWLRLTGRMTVSHDHTIIGYIEVASDRQSALVRFCDKNGKPAREETMLRQSLGSRVRRRLWQLVREVFRGTRLAIASPSSTTFADVYWRIGGARYVKVPGIGWFESLRPVRINALKVGSRRRNALVVGTIRLDENGVEGTAVLFDSFDEPDHTARFVEQRGRGRRAFLLERLRGRVGRTALLRVGASDNYATVWATWTEVRAIELPNGRRLEPVIPLAVRPGKWRISQ